MKQGLASRLSLCDRSGVSCVNLKDVTGRVFGELTVVSHKVGVGFYCLCSCGESHIERYSWPLTSGNRTRCRSCGFQRASWTKDEDRTLKKYHGVLTLKEIGKLLGRSRYSVKGRVSRLGLSGSGAIVGDNHPQTKYPESDVELVRQLGDVGVSSRSIADKMEMPLRYVQAILAYEKRKGELL